MDNSTFLMAAALLPPIYLLFEIYRLDRIEKEPISLLIKLFFFGVLTTFAASMIEVILTGFLGSILPSSTLLYALIENFLIVAWAEEGVKHFALKRGSWKHSAFDYCFDAIVYATAVSLGFAAFENVMYVFSYNGFPTALVRTFTAIPGHCIFGIFMGYYYAMAKYYSHAGMRDKEKHYQLMSLLIPILLHGFYDFAAGLSGAILSWVFWIYIIILDITAIYLVRRCSRMDSPV